MEHARHERPVHTYRLETFEELPPLIVGPDGRCTCTQADCCPLRRTGAAERCTLDDLRKLDREAQRRRAWQSG